MSNKVSLKQHKGLNKFWHPESGFAFNEDKYVVGIIVDDQIKRLTQTKAQEALKMKFKLSPDIEYSEEEEDEETEEEETDEENDDVAQVVQVAQPQPVPQVVQVAQPQPTQPQPTQTVPVQSTSNTTNQIFQDINNISNQVQQLFNEIESLKQSRTSLSSKLEEMTKECELYKQKFNAVKSLFN
jgi:regulator of replication initiation timing